MDMGVARAAGGHSSGNGNSVHAPYFDRLRTAVGLSPVQGGRKADSGPRQASPEELDALLRSSKPIIVAVVGIAGLIALLWLMVLKPF